MRVRKLTAVVGMTAVTALAMGGLTACDSKVGQAAIVGGHRISESDLSKYVSPAGAAPSVLAAAAKAGQSVYPKTEVVQILIQQQLFERTLAKNGGVPTKGELAALHDQAAATFLGTQLTGAALDSYLKSAQGSYGYGSSYAQALLHTIELEAALAVKVKAQSLADLAAAVNKLNITVEVNPRYGKWDPKNLTLGGPTSNIPDFLKLDGVSTPASTASAAASN
ncbi:MAG: hypothetical protein JWP07_772 [Pseudonocardiales bacterium]|nr:hypothetical protein [Pseudonocardiales bacterium]